jgi:hypothetical protein
MGDFERWKLRLFRWEFIKHIARAHVGGFVLKKMLFYCGYCGLVVEQQIPND